MRERNLQRNHIEVLVAIARMRSVHAAARALGKTQPAISRLAAEAERILGTKLFERSSQGSRLAPGGEALLGQAQFVLRAMERLGSAADNSRAAIALGCIPRAMHTLMPNLLERMHADAAPIRLKVSEGSSAALAAAVGSAGLDFAILRHETPDPQASARFAFDPLYEERTVVICGTQNKSVSEARLSIGALLRLPWVLPMAETASRASFDRFLSSHGLAPVSPVIEARSFESNLALVSGSSRFLSIAPEPIALRHAAYGAVRIVKLRQGLPTSRVALMRHRNAIDDRVLERFRLSVLDAAGATRVALAAGRRRW